VASRLPRQHSISVLCVTDGPTERVARILAQLRAVASEIVCGVDARVDPGDISALDGVADETFRCVIDPESGIERTLPWLYSKCSCDWILRVDGDEVVGEELLNSLPALVADAEIQQYAVPLRWLHPDIAHYLTERPWNDDWHIRLTRNHPGALRFPGTLHSDVQPAFPYRHVDLPIYHLACALATFAERKAKAAYMAMLQPGHEILPGWPASHFFLPEKFASGQPREVPPGDRIQIEEVLSPMPTAVRRPALRFGRRRTRNHPEVVGLQQTDAYWGRRTFSEAAYRATWLRCPEITTMPVNGVERLLVEVRNDGDEVWPYGDTQPMIRFGQRWWSADGTRIVAEPDRTIFDAPVRPGESLLQRITINAPAEAGRFVLELDLVHEHVRWFGCDIRYEVEVRE
jgi:hypothetical protein